MANDYYIVTRGPRSRQRSRADIVTAEMNAIEDGFDKLPSQNDLAGASHLLAVEASTSAANVYVLTSTHQITALKTGAKRLCFIGNTNTGASTVNVDDTGVKDIRSAIGGALVGGELPANWPAELVYNGTHWRLLNSAKALTVSVVLSSSLSPQNYQRNVAISDLTLPTATGGSSPYVYAVTGLPTGLAFAAGTRVLSGTPTLIGTSTVTYTVTDSNGLIFTYQFSIRIVATLIILPDPIDRTLTAGTHYTFTVASATGGTSPYVHSVQDLPAGIVFDEQTRELSGTPSVPDVYTIILSVVDSGTPQQTAQQTFDLTVRSASALSLQVIADRAFEPGAGITPFTLPAASGGVPPYVYIVTGLGEGLTFDENTLEVSGTPNDTGNRVVTLRVEDGVGSHVERQFTITIQPQGFRYIGVSTDDSISATDIRNGEQHGLTAQELTLPTWGGDRRIWLAQPEDSDDFTAISLAGLGNSISDFTKQTYKRTISSIEYEIWVGDDAQGDVIAGDIIEVRP